MRIENKPSEQKFLEDNFDLTTFQNETRKNYMFIYRKKIAPFLKIFNILMILLSFTIAILCYNFLNHAINQWRMEKMMSGTHTANFEYNMREARP